MHPLPLSASPESLMGLSEHQGISHVPCSAMGLPHHRVILVLAFVRSSLLSSIVAVLPTLVGVQGSRLLHVLTDTVIVQSSGV